LDNGVDDDISKQAVALTPRLMASGGFEVLYREGMGLIEEVAAYLDGPGRADSKALSREASFVYATESMRLTTRLMQLASWLLLQRAVNEGEISADQARAEKSKVKFSALPSERGGPGWDELPETMRAYVDKGDRLFARVVKFDKAERGEVEPADNDRENAVSAQMQRLKAAFGGMG
jgi:regulator of CtrA degradation